jgi:hypothetical protein
MRVVSTPQFWREAREFSFRFCCEDCRYFNRNEASCRHFWPAAEHLREYYATETAAELVFCKEFELA